jgi:putative restriction endonuclease
MARTSVPHRFGRLNVWGLGDQRAPHKPLPVLYALGRWNRGDKADVPFGQVDADLTGLLKEFGPPRRSYHPEYPFCRLQSDGVWVVHASGPLTPCQGSTGVRKSDLLARDAAGGFAPEVQAALRSHPAPVSEAGVGASRRSPFAEGLRPALRISRYSRSLMATHCESSACVAVVHTA